MIVVADSGPLHYLILLEQTELLHRLYGQVIVPQPRSIPPAVARIDGAFDRLLDHDLDSYFPAAYGTRL